MKVKHESTDWVELSTKEGSTKFALHLTEKRTEDRVRAATKIHTMLLGFTVRDLEYYYLRKGDSRVVQLQSYC